MPYVKSGFPALAALTWAGDLHLVALALVQGVQFQSLGLPSEEIANLKLVA